MLFMIAEFAVIFVFLVFFLAITVRETYRASALRQTPRQLAAKPEQAPHVPAHARKDRGAIPRWATVSLAPLADLRETLSSSGTAEQ